MKRLERPQTRLSDSQVSEALRNLLTPTDEPKLRTGFNRRLERAVAADERSRRRTRVRRRVLLGYWIASGATSAAIVWQFHDRLASGLGLWLFVGGLVTLAAASLTLSLLAALPVGLTRRIRS